MNIQGRFQTGFVFQGLILMMKSTRKPVLIRPFGLHLNFTQLTPHLVNRVVFLTCHLRQVANELEADERPQVTL